MRSQLLCLLDVDGTLVHVAEELAFTRAFREQCAKWPRITARDPAMPATVATSAAIGIGAPR